MNNQSVHAGSAESSGTLTATNLNQRLITASNSIINLLTPGSKGFVSLTARSISGNRPMSNGRPAVSRFLAWRMAMMRLTSTPLYLTIRLKFKKSQTDFAT